MRSEDDKRKADIKIASLEKLQAQNNEEIKKLSLQVDEMKYKLYDQGQLVERLEGDAKAHKVDSQKSLKEVEARNEELERQVNAQKQ